MEKIVTLPGLPERPEGGHKGMFGRVLVVGGSEGMIGAPVFSATAALRMGVGLVQIAVPRSILGHCLTITPELIGLGLARAGRHRELVEAGEKADAIAVGPGLGTSAEARERLNRLIRLDRPMVLDADALNLLAAGKKWPVGFKAKAVLTPHPGEMVRLLALLPKKNKLRLLRTIPTDEASRVEIATALAKTTGQGVVLKGQNSVITDGLRYAINTTGDSTLSKAGTGDVLTGIIVCLLAQGMSSFDAARLGCHLHGLAGELAGKRVGKRSAITREVIEEIAKALAII